MSAAIVVIQIAWILLSAWARGDVSRERRLFRPFEPFLGSDLLVFVVPFILSISALVVLPPYPARLPSAAVWVLAVVLAVIGEFVALSIALNVWGG